MTAARVGKNDSEFLDRRTARRFQLNIVFEFRKRGQVEIWSGSTENISTRGVFFRTMQPFNVDEVLEFSLTLPGLTAQITGRARVLRLLKVFEADQVGVAAAIDEYHILKAERFHGASDLRPFDN